MSGAEFALIAVLTAALIGVTVAYLRACRDLEAAARGAVVDVSPRAEVAETELEGLHAALDATSLGVVLVDGTGTLTYSNAAADVVLAGRAGEAVLRRELLDALDDARATGAEQKRDVDLYAPTRRLVRVRAVGVEGDGAAAYIRDLSDQVRVEALRRDFVANAGHELKTPLGALALLAETRGDVDDDEQRRRLEDRLTHEARRLGQLVDDILILGAIESETAPFELVRLSEILEEARDRVALIADGAGVTIEHEAPQTDIWVDGNREQLVSAVANLLDNAVKYSEGPGALVTCRATLDDGEISIAVHDDGIGIAEPHLDRVFERFYRVDRARSRESGGTGLGLSIVRNVARTHGGSVSVESTLGDGSTFEIRLPVSKSGEA